MPFGGSSCPSIFSGYSLATKWIIARYTSFSINDIVNMLDDNLFVSPPGPHEEGEPDILGKNLMVYKEEEADRVILNMGWRLKAMKATHATNTLCYLGINIDTIAQTLSIPD